MLWRRRPRDQAAAAAPRDEIAPAALAVTLSEEAFEVLFTHAFAIAEVDGGVETYLEALAGKRDRFAAALAPEAMAAFGLAEAEALMATVFTARRRLWPAFTALGEAGVRGLVESLLHGDAPLAERIERFVATVPVPSGETLETRKAAARVRRGAHDFAAELLHFREPDRYPLMTRWVWDAAQRTGAQREFVVGAATEDRIELAGDPGTFEAVRQWLATRIEAKGIYRDVPLWVDVVLGSAYSEYFRQVAGGMLGQDFTRGAGPEEEFKKLLGIDSGRRGGKSRVRREVPA
jgi:hypothetical protein